MSPSQLLVMAFFELDVNKMTSGVFRHGELASSSKAKVLFSRDGKTSTVHLVDYSGTYSIRTNGKSDGSVVMNEGERGSDEITMVLTGAIPLAIKPEARSAALIGIGTGLTMHTLLQSLDIERVETVEIEAAMAEAARGFSPRNAAAWADPRGSVLIDDAKTFFSTRNRTYDILISEPSNPWVSGVSSLFTQEFYRRIRTHLNPGGLLVQWFQLYEIDTSLVASVLGSLGETFPHYVIYAPSDHDLLIIASETPIPRARMGKALEHPGLARELFTINVLTAGDLDARYLGSRATLEPLFLTYGMPPNSDFYPVLDLNAARHRYTERSAVEVVTLTNLGVPVLEMLERRRREGSINPMYSGALSFDRIENTRRAAYIRDYLIDPRTPAPVAITAQMQKDIEMVKLRLLDCREAREQDVWLQALVAIAQEMNPFLPPEEAERVWQRLVAAPCHAGLATSQQQWIELLRAIGRRDAARMGELGAQMLAAQAEINADSRELLWMAALTGRLAAGEREAALKLWEDYAERMPRSVPKPVFRLLRCHAEAGGPDARAKACAAPFTAWARP